MAAFFIKQIRVWRIMQCGNTTAWLDPGWYLHTCRPHSYTPISGWRLARHRVLWGFGRGLVDPR
ncbi:peptidase inhibitor I9 [Mycolicibacterium canariasense]|uniref:Peptidase inhibitor I9 n=1 Tax=Mycolicibacterium canariasense TaxID=228230 RepID=A0A100WIC5_MYCCR|nr:hypothetical protein [Mycolicibacterium canariasense]MCV7210186.1 hypothetical protein [Mycolicibacterium canariasense]ORV14585.1 hypothetical protein AWB94_04285 [Mycolicibacterium canariasense]GAS98841.1 peptidase inhibitor I9 [Mycolicibacterium canariasense]